MKKSVLILFLSFLFAWSLSAVDTLVNVSDADALNCPEGGAKIEIGKDDNENNVLDSEEVDVVKYVCNGSDGSDNNIVISNEPAGGTSCGDRGGVKITIGSNSRYVCNGPKGDSALFEISDAEVSDCPNGGIKIEAGIDTNGNGSLDSSNNEITVSEPICNGLDGIDGHDAITKVTEEKKGDNCKNGDGVKIEVGIDKNDNGVLDEGEAQGDPYYVCNGKNGSQGPQGPKGDQGEPGENGTDGKDGEPGEKGDQGPKGDQGEQGETGATGESGKNGATSLVSVVDEPAGENCASGGKKIELGLDVNGNGTLDEDEVDSESVYYVCNGRDAEEAGLASSSTGCSVSAVDDYDEAIMFVSAIVSMIIAFVAVKFVRG